MSLILYMCMLDSAYSVSTKLAKLYLATLSILYKIVQTAINHCTHTFIYSFSTVVVQLRGSVRRGTYEQAHNTLTLLV
jgi:hypothetical protein